MGGPRMLDVQPDWSPQWADVRFDHAAAAQAADACRRAIRTFENVADASARAAGTATRDWTGRAQDEFETAHRRWLERCAAQVDELLRTIELIEGAADQARTAQVARERDRDRWYAERHALRADAEAG